MKQKVKKKSKWNHSPNKKGLPPGSTIYTGNNIIPKPSISIIDYSDDPVVFSYPELSEVVNDNSAYSKRWINLNGISDEKYVRDICTKFNIHYLYQEDIMNIFQRPKIEEEDDYLFLTLKSIEWNSEVNDIEEEQFSFFILANTVITFQEKEGDNMGVVREKFKLATSVIKEKSIDYLLYRLIDVTIDNYFDVLEKMGDYLEEIETEIMNSPTKDVLGKIQSTKKDIMQIRKNIYPLRDVLNKIINTDHPLIEEKTKRYFKDVLDHTVQILETIETYRDINISMKDVYLNSVSNEMNKIMKILTIISTLFIPLTFIVGVYGMNFKYMPELNYQYGYYLIWLVMGVIATFSGIWFWKKGWL